MLAVKVIRQISFPFQIHCKLFEVVTSKASKEDWESSHSSPSGRSPYVCIISLLIDPWNLEGIYKLFRVSDSEF